MLLASASEVESVDAPKKSMTSDEQQLAMQTQNNQHKMNIVFGGATFVEKLKNETMQLIGLLLLTVK